VHVVSWLKYFVSDPSLISCCNQKHNTQFNGKPIAPKRTLDSVGIKHGDVIDLAGFGVRVKDLDGKVHTLLCEPTDTIDDIKKQIEKKTKTPKADQRLSHKGTPLDKNSKTLNDCNIVNNDLLELSPMEIKVRAPNGDICKLECNPQDPIEDIKDRVAKQLGIPVANQRPEVGKIYHMLLCMLFLG
jgi:hypothetical protein